MSSGPKRKGCDVCRKRHVKCDRQVPSCSQCQKAGWTCPGYSTDFSFVNYSQEFPTGRPRGNQDEGISGFGNSSRRSTSRAKGEGSSTPVPLSRIMPRPSTPASPPVSPAESLKQKFIWALDNKTIAASFETLSPESYLRPLPELIGESQAMDEAMHLVTLASSLPPGSRDVSTSNDHSLMAAHSACIKSLRDALVDEKKVKERGTLVAALLLKMYEQHSNQDSPAREFHAQGVAKLIQNRGPESFRDDVDLAILEAELANVFFVCMKEGEECFLAEPAWREVFVRMANVHSRRPGRMTPEQLDLMNSWCCIPGSQAAFHDWLDIQAIIASGERRAESLSPPGMLRNSPDPIPIADYLLMHRRRLREWWSRHLPIPHQHDSGPWTDDYDLIIHLSIAVQLGCVDYMLATVSPDSASKEAPIELPGEQRDNHAVDLGPRPYDLPNDFIAECRHLALMVRKYAEWRPDHPFLADGTTRLSLKYAWETTTNYRQDLISEESAKIAELFDWAFSAKTGSATLVDRTR